jgi:hypothetical protein
MVDLRIFSPSERTIFRSIVSSGARGLDRSDELWKSNGGEDFPRNGFGRMYSGMTFVFLFFAVEPWDGDFCQT